MGFVALGLDMSWSGDLWAAAGVVAVVYVGIPVAAATLIDLTKPRQNARNNDLEESGSNNSLLVGGQKEERRSDGTPMTRRDMDFPMMRNELTGDNGPLHTEPVNGKSDKIHSQSREIPPSSDFLQQWISERSERPVQRPEWSSERPWRRVGSTQFAALIQALSAALPAVDTADDTADLSGVRRYLIRKGRDTPKQRWLAVLEQAINDSVDDFVCSEALKLTDSKQLRAAVADWLGISGG
jgi:hypothetical protein